MNVTLYSVQTFTFQEEPFENALTSQNDLLFNACSSDHKYC